MRGQSIQLLDSFGIEVESEGLFNYINIPADIQHLFQREHDASIETPVFINPDLEVNQFFKRRESDRDSERIIGTEYVSTILNYNNKEHLDAITKLLYFLYENGEEEQSKRSSIHFHINMGYNRDILRNILKLSSYTELLFYYLGSMGYEFRGLENDFTYCRSLFNPAIVNSDSPFYCYSYKNLVDGSQRSAEYFFDAYGGINEENPPGKYNPMRYGWITFYPLLTKKTLELRVCNKSLNSNYVLSMLKLFRAFCEGCLYSRIPDDLPENPVYISHSKEDVLNTLMNLRRFLNFDDRTLKTLGLMIERSPKIDVTPAKVWTHLRNYTTPKFSHYSPEFVSGNIKSPEFVDIHTLGR